MKKSINIGLLGLGTVGTGVVRVLERNRDLIKSRIGVPLNVVRIAVRDIKKDRGISLENGVITTDPFDVIRDPNVDIVLELIGGCDQARELVLATIAEKKPLVTANKALLAEHGPELRALASQMGVSFRFEASVGGGIPVIKTLREALAANRILSVYGIINGTSNYILTKMSDEGRSFDEVLDEAQKEGYAEADPTFDVEGIDSAHKLTIIIDLAFGVSLDFKQIYTEGITGISHLDIELGKELGYTLKLLAIAKSKDGKLEARVHPSLVLDSDPIAKVGGVYNVVKIVGDAVEDLVLYGRGAGQGPTASAVVSDVMDISRDIQASGGLSRFSKFPTDGTSVDLQPMETISSRYYLRFIAEGQTTAVSQVSDILTNHGVSIKSVTEKIQESRKPGPLVVMTNIAIEGNVLEAVHEIEKLSGILEKGILIRVASTDLNGC